MSAAAAPNEFGRAGDGSPPATTQRNSARSCATALVVISLFLERIVDAAYQGAGRELPKALPVLGTVFMITSLYAWFWSYSQTHRIPMVMDMGWFLFAAWVVLLPYYILRAEGRRGWATIGLFCLTWFAAFATGWATLIWSRLLLG